MVLLKVYSYWQHETLLDIQCRILRSLSYYTNVESLLCGVLWDWGSNHIAAMFLVWDKFCFELLSPNDAEGHIKEGLNTK